jgi:hypothetical protein
MKEDGVRLPRVGSPQQDNVRLFDLTVRAGAPARPEYSRQTGDAGGVSSTVATIDMVAADHRTHELLGRIIQLVGGFRATEHPERIGSVFRELNLETLRDAIKGLIPTCWMMAAVFPD